MAQMVHMRTEVAFQGQIMTCFFDGELTVTVSDVCPRQFSHCNLKP